MQVSKLSLEIVLPFEDHMLYLSKVRSISKAIGLWKYSFCVMKSLEFFLCLGLWVAGLCLPQLAAKLKCVGSALRADVERFARQNSHRSQGDLSEISEVLRNNSVRLSTVVLRFDSSRQREDVGDGNHKFHQYETKFRDQTAASPVDRSDEISEFVVFASTVVYCSVVVLLSWTRQLTL